MSEKNTSDFFFKWNSNTSSKKERKKVFSKKIGINSSLGWQWENTDLNLWPQEDTNFLLPVWLGFFNFPYLGSSSSNFKHLRFSSCRNLLFRQLHIPNFSSFRHFKPVQKKWCNKFVSLHHLFNKFKLVWQFWNLLSVYYWTHRICKKKYLNW